MAGRCRPELRHATARADRGRSRRGSPTHRIGPGLCRILTRSRSISKGTDRSARRRGLDGCCALGAGQDASWIEERSRLVWADLCRTWNLVSRNSRRGERSYRYSFAVHALQCAHVVDDVPTIHLLDSIVGRHQSAAVANHPEDVSVGACLGHVGGQIDSGHAESRGGTVTHGAIAVTHGAIDLEVFSAV